MTAVPLYGATETDVRQSMSAARVHGATETNARQLAVAAPLHRARETAFRKFVIAAPLQTVRGTAECCYLRLHRESQKSPSLAAATKPTETYSWWVTLLIDWSVPPWGA